MKINFAKSSKYELSGNLDRNLSRLDLMEAMNVETEKNLDNTSTTDIRIAEGVEKMKPLMKLLIALKNQVGEVNGLEIRPVETGHEAGHIVIVQARSAVSTDSYSISTNNDNSLFMVEGFCSFSGDGSFRADNYEYDTVNEVMTKVMNLVAEHIGEVEAGLAREYV
jgi:hypothetical protein